ncbi:DMT family transporter [Parasphingorhabdus sp.]|uniref:DMT family transporter n=1 Tax=Parasphingorhabdus sp. TaxID=2709688 RepID=UPI0032984121
MTRTDLPSFGIALRILSGALIAGMYICVKAVSGAVPLGEIVFFRSLFALIPLVLFLMLQREFPKGLATKRPLDHLLRAGFGAVALFSAFAALARLNIAEAILIAQLSPLLTALAAVVFLSERLTIWRVAGLAFGFAGVVTLVWPELQLGEMGQARFFGVAFGVVSAVFSALALIMVRQLNRTENAGAIALYFVMASMIGAMLTIPWGWLLPDHWALACLVGAGLCGGLGHIAMTLSFRYAEASRLAPFEYIALFWPLIADLFIFSLPLSSTFLIAVPLVLMGSAVAALKGANAVKTSSGIKRAST